MRGRYGLAITIFLLGVILAGGWALLVVPQRAQAATLCVTTDGSGGCYTTIQAAVDAAGVSDTVRVAQGTYFEAVIIDQKSITLEGSWNSDFSQRDWDSYPTIIDAGGAGPVIKTIPIPSGAISVTIEGFTLMHGDDSAGLGWGGGLQLMDEFDGASYFVVRHNVISNNTACQGASCQGYGGGIMVYGGRAIIEDNFIGNNIARNVAHLSGRGGGICIHGYAEAEIISNTIIANTAVMSTTGLAVGQGGGVDLSYAGDVTLRDNLIELNVAALNGTGYGGGVYAADDLYDNHILNNRASQNGTGYGGGVYAYHVGEMMGNVIEENTASVTADGSGGGVYVQYLQLARQNEIRNNTATRGGGVYYQAYSGNQEFMHNQVSGNQATGTSDATRDGGGGIASQADWVEIRHNDIISNTGYYGPGVLVTAGNRYTIADNYIATNGLTSTLCAGGGIAVYSSTGTIADNQIVGNLSSIGGGIYLFGRAAPVLDRNVIADNFAMGFIGAGGGVMINVQTGTIVTLTNHIIARNGAGANGYGGGVYCWLGDCHLINNTIVDNNRGSHQEGVMVSGFSPARAWLRNNLIVGHSVGVSVTSGVVDLDYNNYYANTLDLNVPSGPHDRTDAPAFIDQVGGDYHLALTSPLIDQGDPVQYVNRDFEGDLRPRGAGIDIGADEAYRSETYVSQITGSDTSGNGSASQPYQTVTKGLQETQTGGIIYIGRGHYLERIHILRSVQLLGGYNESNWERDIATYHSILDADGSGTTVFIAGDKVNALLEGFTITGGEADLFGIGGGIFVLDNAVATIARNVIHGNHAQNGGGGVALWANAYQQSVLESNLVYNNHADGIFPSPPLNGELPAAFQQGQEPGGGVLVFSPALLVNNIIYNNTSAYAGDGLAMGQNQYGPIQLLHNTIANNAEEGILIVGVGSSIELYNNLIVGHATAISATAAFTWDNNGFYANTQNYAPGLPDGMHDFTANPGFVNAASGDYHLTISSPMAGMGSAAGIFADFDGQARPQPSGTPPDIGADEINQHHIYLPLILR